MRVVVTGGAGLVGRFVVAELLRRVPGSVGPSHEVAVFDRVGPPGGEPPGRSAGPPVRWLSGDVQDLEAVAAALAGAEAVIHLAAVPRPGGVPDEALFRNNVIGAWNVHEAACRHGIGRVVSASSTAVLGWDWGRRDRPPAYLPIDEDHPVCPQDAYGLSKQAGEAIAASYHARSGMETPVLRPPWVVSPAQLAALRAAGGRRPEGFHHYAYVDVRDLARAFRLALERPAVGHAVVFTAAPDTSTAEPLGTLLPRLLPAAAALAGAVRGADSAIDSSRARALLGWEARHSWRRPEPAGPADPIDPEAAAAPG